MSAHKEKPPPAPVTRIDCPACGCCFAIRHDVVVVPDICRDRVVAAGILPGDPPERAALRAAVAGYRARYQGIVRDEGQSSDWLAGWDLGERDRRAG